MVLFEKVFQIVARLIIFIGWFHLSVFDIFNRLLSLILNRNLPLSILIGIPLTTGCYVLVNIAYLTVLGPEKIIQSEAVAMVTISIQCDGLISYQFTHQQIAPDTVLTGLKFALRIGPILFSVKLHFWFR